MVSFHWIILDFAVLFFSILELVICLLRMVILFLVDASDCRITCFGPNLWILSLDLNSLLQSMIKLFISNLIWCLETPVFNFYFGRGSLKTSVDEEPEEADLAIPSGVVAILGEYSNSSIGAALFLLVSYDQSLFSLEHRFA
jgi:hypothetical protein